MIRPDSGLIVVALAFISLASIDPEYQAGKLAFDKGEYGEAKRLFEKVCKINPSDLNVKIALASVLNTSDALAIYNETASLTSAPDSVRAKAFTMLGDYYYLSKQYSKAAESYDCASKLAKSPHLRHYRALASFANGDLETAKSIWTTLTLENNEEISQMAQYYLGLLKLKQGLYDQAYDTFLKSGNGKQNFWDVPCIAGKLECAIRMGMGEKINVYEKQMPQRNLILEKEYIEIADEQKGKADTVVHKEKPSVSDKSQDPFYTLQVGAFGSMKNASAAQKRIVKNFKDVTISPVTVAGKTLYRVLIGAFKNKKEAESFGTDSLKMAGLSYRIIIK